MFQLRARKRYSSKARRSFYIANLEHNRVRSIEYNKRKRDNDPLFRENERFRNLIKQFRSVGATKGEIDEHRLVSRETYLLWLNYQQAAKGVSNGFAIHHSYPQAKLSANNQVDRLIATNVVNLSPMSVVDNAAKGCKIIPELLINQISVANAFLAVADLSYDEKLKFKFLTEMFTAYVKFKLGVE